MCLTENNRLFSAQLAIYLPLANIKMKILISLILLNYTFVFGQEIKLGAYISENGFETNIIEFKEDNKFVCYFSGCTGSSIGIGTYTRKKNKIDLKFSPSYKLNYTENINFIKSDSNIIIIDIVIKDEENEYPLPGVDCYIVDTNIGGTSDFNGNLSLKIKRDALPKKLMIKSVGYADQIIHLENDISKITGEIKLNQTSILSTKNNKTLKIYSSSKKSFTTIKRRKYLDIYNSISKNKMIKIIENETDKTYDYFFN